MCEKLNFELFFAATGPVTTAAAAVVCLASGISDAL